MRWLTARTLETWAGERLDARAVLPRLVGRLIRASASDITTFRFPAGDSAQIEGWDGRLKAEPCDPYKAFVPQGDSVWEFGVEKTPSKKAEEDYKKRTDSTDEAIVKGETTFVFVTPRIWARADKWCASKSENSPWKDVRVIDSVDLEEWLGLCQGVASTFARENGFALRSDVQCIDEFWESYSLKFTPQLREEVLLAGRTEQRQQLEKDLISGLGIQQCKGDSLDEVLAFMCATIRTAEVGLAENLRARTIIVESEDAARQLRDQPNLIFAVRGAAIDISGILSDRHRVIVPMGRDAIKPSQSIALSRPTAYEMSEGLKSMGYSPEEAWRLAHACGRSVSILSRRIPSTSARRTEWSNDARLVPLFLAGAWDQSCEADRTIVTALAGMKSYDEVEQSLRGFLTAPDTPVEVVGTVWAVRAPVDLFVQISHLLQPRDWPRLKKAAHTVLAEKDPAMELPPSERLYAKLHGKVLAHSHWLRDGLATTLLILAAMGTETEVSVEGRPPQEFVNGLVDMLPGLREDHRVLASLSHQLPMLMEAAPHPIISALEHLLGGDGAKLKPIFQDSRENQSLWSSSPHTGLLWALELIGQDPKFLQRAARILARLDAIDPGGSLSNRPLGSLRSLFLTWKPATNASHELRLAVLDHLMDAEPEIAWRLISSLLPKMSGFQVEPTKPTFRELGASEREILTYPIMFETIAHIARRAWHSPLSMGTGGCSVEGGPPPTAKRSADDDPGIQLVRGEDERRGAICNLEGPFRGHHEASLVPIDRLGLKGKRSRNAGADRRSTRTPGARRQGSLSIRRKAAAHPEPRGRKSR